MEQNHQPFSWRRYVTLAWLSGVVVGSGFIAGVFYSTAVHGNRLSDWLIFSGAVVFALAGIARLAMWSWPDNE